MMPGARRSFQVVAQLFLKMGDSGVVSALAHYMEFLAIEVEGDVVREVPSK